MNILDYINNAEDVKKVEFEYNNERIKCYVKELSQAESEKIGQESVKLMPIFKKQEKGQPLSDKEAKIIASYQSKQVFEILCDKNGDRLFSEYESFKNKIKGKFFKALVDNIIDNPVDEAEKN